MDSRLGPERRLIAAALPAGWQFLRRPPATDDDERLHLSGWFERNRTLRRRRLRGVDLEIEVGHAALRLQSGCGSVATLQALYFPHRLQRRGFGTDLVLSLAEHWQNMGVDEVQARVGTRAGEHALASWGFRAVPVDGSELPLRCFSLAAASPRGLGYA